MERRLIRILTATVALDGPLQIPDRLRGIVLFAHGSGSSRQSPRNVHVAAVVAPPGSRDAALRSAHRNTRQPIAATSLTSRSSLAGSRCAAEAVRPERNDLRVEAVISDREPHNRHRQREAPRSRTPGIDPEDAVPVLDRRPMRVPVHHDGHPTRDGGPAERLAVVDHEQSTPADRERRPVRQPRGPRAPIVVPPHGGHRRDRAQRHQHLRRPDVSRMHDSLDPPERRKCLRSHQAVRVRDETDDALPGAHGPGRIAFGT